MMRAVVLCVLCGIALTACSKHEEQKPSAPPPATTSSIAPPQLTITNLPTPVPATNTGVAKIQRGIQVKNAGNLFLSFPASWRDALGRVSERGRWFDSMQFRPKDGDAFALIVNVNNVGQTNVERLDIHAELQKAWEAQSTNAVEKSLEIHDLEGREVKACYFVMTDKNRTIAAPKQGEFLYLTQGYAKIGTLILSFRFVSNHLEAEQGQMLDMIKTARFVKKK
jgi:hypothetical protein